VSSEDHIVCSIELYIRLIRLLVSVRCVYTLLERDDAPKHGRASITHALSINVGGSARMNTRCNRLTRRRDVIYIDDMHRSVASFVVRGVPYEITRLSLAHAHCTDSYIL